MGSNGCPDSEPHLPHYWEPPSSTQVVRLYYCNGQDTDE